MPSGKRARVLLLIPSASYRAPDFMAAAGKLGIEVVVGSDVRHPLQEMWPDRHVALDFADADLAAGEIEEFADQFPLDAILAVDDAGTRIAARASRRLELPHNPVAAVEATRNKHLLREHLAAAGVPSPPFRTWPVGLDPDPLSSVLAFPVVVKPLSLSASRGVIRADDMAQLRIALERVGRILADPANAGECAGFADLVLIEGYIPGIEVAVEGLLVAGRLSVLAVFDKPDPLEGPYFEETIYVTPSRLDAADLQRVIATTEAAARALGLEDGPLHAESRLNPEGAFPIDIAARSIGGLCSRTLAFGSGMSLEEIILRHAIGANPATLEREGRAAGVMMIPIPAAGRLEAVEGVAEAEGVALIESVTISIPLGGELVPLPEGGDYLGFIFAKGETPEAVEAALRAAHGRLRFLIDPSPGSRPG